MLQLQHVCPNKAMELTVELAHIIHHMFSDQGPDWLN